MHEKMFIVILIFEGLDMLFCDHLRSLWSSDIWNPLPSLNMFLDILDTSLCQIVYEFQVQQYPTCFLILKIYFPKINWFLKPSPPLVPTFQIESTIEAQQKTEALDKHSLNRSQGCTHRGTWTNNRSRWRDHQTVQKVRSRCGHSKSFSVGLAWEHQWLALQEGFGCFAVGRSTHVWGYMASGSLQRIGRIDCDLMSVYSELQFFVGPRSWLLFEKLGMEERSHDAIKKHVRYCWTWKL